FAALEMGEVQAAAAKVGLEVVTLEIRRAQDIVPAFETLKGRSEALYLSIDAVANTNRIPINILAVGARLPTMHGSRDYVEAGGLMSFGANFPISFGVPPIMSTRFCAGRNRPTFRSSSRPNSI